MQSLDQNAILANARLSHGNGIVVSAAKTTLSLQPLSAFECNGVYMMCAALKQISMEV
jgi:hypothetical protein